MSLQDAFNRNSELCLDGHITRLSTHAVAAGGFADVWEGIFGSRKVAIKVLRPFASTGVRVGRPKLLKRLWREYLAWSSLSHPNIIECLGFSHDFSLESYIVPSLISPWMSNGTITSYLHDHPEADRLQLLVGVAEGLSYLHTREAVIVHGDLRAGNILISDHGIPCLSDSGLSRVLNEVKGITTSNDVSGSLRWMSPERFQDNRSATVHSDIWAYGMTALEILSGERPYAEIKNDIFVLIEIKDGHVPSRPQVPKEHEALFHAIWTICQGCWSLEPIQRPSMREVISMLCSEFDLAVEFDRMQVPAGFNESCDLFFVSVCALRGEEGFGQPSLVPEPPPPELGGKDQPRQRARDRNGSLPPTFSVYRAIAERDVNPSAFSPTLSFAATHQDHPPLLTPLLHALSLLHRAVTARRQAHYQPSTACVVSCVRSLLMSTECLHREAPVLRRVPQLAQERKFILGNLGTLVSQARRCSNWPGADSDGDRVWDRTAMAQAEIQQQDWEPEQMLRMSGEVLQNMSLFLEVCEQNGIELPAPRETFTHGQEPGNSGSEPEAGMREMVDLEVAKPTPRTMTRRRAQSGSTAMLGSGSGTGVSRNAINGNAQFPLRPFDKMAGLSSMRTKSLSDLRERRHTEQAECARQMGTDVMPMPTSMARGVSEEPASVVHRQIHRPNQLSISSISSQTSGSVDSNGSPITPSFPPGSCTTEQVLSVLRATHDVLSSTVAAFIGQVHSYDRDSKPSRKGDLIDLTRETVDMIRQLLMLVEAVARHPDIAAGKIEMLQTAKHSLFGATNDLVEAMGETTGETATAVSEMERRRMLHGATGVLRVAVECVAAVKVCLTRPTGEDPFIICLPPAESVRSSPGATRVGSKRQWPVSYHGHRFLSVLSLQEQESSPSRSSFEAGELSVSPSDSTVPHTPTSPGPLFPLLDVDVFCHDYDVRDVAYNSKGAIVGATFEVMVENMTPHDAPVEFAFYQIFMMTWRLFGSPPEFVSALINRYNLQPSMMLRDDDRKVWIKRKATPVKLRVSNLVKTWVENYWRAETDDAVLTKLSQFVRESIALQFPAPAQRILEHIRARTLSDDSVVSPHPIDRTKSMDWLREGSLAPPTPVSLSKIPRSTIDKTVLAALKNKNFGGVTITDFDALELARQFTIMESRLYLLIQPEEVLELEQPRAAINLNAIGTLSTAITGWVTESILNESDAKKRTHLVKFFIKVADRCLGINNYSTSRSILAALDSSIISQLHQAWSALPQKTMVQLESLRKMADHARNHSEYRSRLRDTTPPAIPFLGLCLTDVTLCHKRNPTHRVSPHDQQRKLINFDKYRRLARLVQDMQRFQVSYNLKEIAEVQQYLRAQFVNVKNAGDLQNL